jgi:hypothetical protein
MISGSIKGKSPTPGAGLEPATLPLTAGCSTIELPGNWTLYDGNAEIVEKKLWRHNEADYSSKIDRFLRMKPILWV